MRSVTVDLDGPVHYADFGGDGPPIVLVHGLGGSHVNWMRVGAALAELGRVVALDLAGFGRTPPDRRAPSVVANRVLLDRFLAEVVGAPALLVGNSMGGVVALLEAARRPRRVRGLVLVDPALPPTADGRPDPRFALRGLLMLAPVVGDVIQRARVERTSPEERVGEILRLVCTDPARIPSDVVEAHVALVRDRDLMPWSVGAHLEAARSLVLPLTPPVFARTVATVHVPTLLVHGVEDRLVPVASARRLAGWRQDWGYAELPDVGHTPMLETPDAFLESMRPFAEATAAR